jgi:PIN domain nuclease of toxin-antitoxin system
VLVDTQVLIWYAMAPERVSRKATQTIGKGNHVYSYASVWELAIKSGANKIELRQHGECVTAKQFIAAASSSMLLSLLPLELDDFATLESLPSHHKDPFDRLLIAQAHGRGFPIISADPVFDEYGLKRVW